MKLGWIGLLLLLWPLMGCNGPSEAATDASKATAGKSGATLRIVRRTHPDPAWMTEHLQGRIDMCMAVLRSKGQGGTPPPLPSAADIARWVTVEEEEIYANNQLARFGQLVFVSADADQGCKLMFHKQVHASTEALCGAKYAGSAKSEPAPATAEPPEFSEDPAGDRPEFVKHCLSDMPKVRDRSAMAQGVTPSGQACVWLEGDGLEGKGVVEPKAPGVYACMHPRFYDGSLPVGNKAGDGALVLRSVRVLAAGEKVSDGLKFGMPETNAMRAEAEIVEDGQAIPAARFSRQAVEAYVRQPLVVPAGVQQ